MDLSISWVFLWTIFVELFLLNASASEDNTHDEDEHYAQLPLYFLDEQTDIVIPLRSPIALQCIVVSSRNDRINITWLKDGDVIVNTTTRWILPDGTLRLEAGEPHTEEGSYECLAKHSIGTIASRRIRLEAPTVPEFVKHPQDFVAFQGESVRLECIANGTPEAVISWVKDGRPLDINRTRVNAFSGVLQIIDATQQDDGTYECLATNAAGQQRSQTAKVTINSSYANERLSPKLLAGPLDQTAVVFDKVVLECFLTGRPRPTVSWMKQGGAMFSLVGRVRVTRYGNLEISSVQLVDAGMYICSWMSTDSSEIKAYAQASVSVLAPPQLVPAGAMNLYTVRHRRQIVRLKCEFEGVPVPRVVWMKNGQVLEPSGRIRIDEWELIVASSDTSDSGFYQCRGENSVGAFQSTTWVEIEANENAPLPPVDLLVIPLTSTSVQLSWRDHPLNQNRSIIAYSIHAFPTRGGLEIQDVRKKEEGSELVWEVFQPFTNYTFYVVAYNVDGGSDHSAYVTAMTTEDVPLESPLMEVIPVGPTGLRLRWSELGPDLARGVIVQYKILHRHHGNSSYQQNLVNADIREFVLQGLHPETEYKVVVLAGTTKGFPLQDSVSWVTVTTEAAETAVVPTPRTEMNISLVSSTSIMVSWMVDGTLQIIRFRLTCRRINQKHHMIPADDVIRIISIDKDANKYIFTELESYAVYQVTLASQNEFGWSDSMTKTFRTDAVINGDAKSSQVDVSEVDLPIPPTKIFAESINSSTIVVRWERPADVSDVTRYTVRYRPDLKETVSDISVVKFVTSPVEMVVIGDLSAHTQYDLSVQTHTSNAIGPFSSVVKCRTEEGIPSEPINIQLTVYSDTTVQVTWHPPAQSNGVIIRYIIFYTTDHRNALSDWLMKTSSGTSLSSLVTYLKPNAIYYFRLQAATFAGHGPLSDIVHIRTQDPSDLHNHDTTDLPTSGVLSDQDLGIIIGTAIGVTCIILCVIFIVIRDRCSAHHAAPATRTHVANGVVTSCRCHLANGSEADPWRMVGSDDDDDFPSVNSVLVENENCDTKGGYTQSERQGRIPVRAVARSGMCNGIQHCDRQPNQHAAKVASSNGNEKAASLEFELSDVDNKVGKLPSKQLSSSVSSEQIASCLVTDSDIIDVEPADTSSKGACGGSKDNNEADDDFPISHLSQEDRACESESLMGTSRRTSHCRQMPVGIAGESTSCIEEDVIGKTTEAEKEEEEMSG